MNGKRKWEQRLSQEDSHPHLADFNAKSHLDLRIQGVCTAQKQFRSGEQRLADYSSSAYHNQISLLSGETQLLWVRATDLVQDIWRDIELRLGIPSDLLIFLYEGKQIEDPLPLSYYNIKRDASVTLSL